MTWPSSSRDEGRSRWPMHAISSARRHSAFSLPTRRVWSTATVTVQAGGKVEFTIRLLPLAGSNLGTDDVDEGSGRSGDRKDDRAVSDRDAQKVEAKSASNDGRPAVLKAPFDAAAAKKFQSTWADHLKSPVVATNSTGMKLVLIPAGEFMMGSPESDRTSASTREALAPGPTWRGVLPGRIRGHAGPVPVGDGRKPERIQGIE